MLWRFVFRMMCIQILVDGFAIYLLFPFPIMHFVKDFFVVATYFLFFGKEPVKDWSRSFGDVLGGSIAGLIFALLFLSVLEIFNPNSPGLLRGILGFKVMYIHWSVMLLAYAYASNPKQILDLFKTIAYLSIPINIFGLLQYTQGPAFMVSHFGPGFIANTSEAMVYGYSGKESFVRIIGTFASAAHYALFLSMNTIISYALFFIDRRKKIIWIAVLFLNIFALLGTGSRGGFVITILMVICFSMLFRRALPLIAASLIMLAGFYFAFSVLRVSVTKRFQTVANIKNLKERSVDTAPKQFLEYLNNYPLGKGIGSATQGSRYLGKLEGKFNLVENYLSKLQLELGIGGVIIFYILIFLILYRWLFQWLGPPRQDPLYILQIAMSAYFFTQMSIGTLFSSIDTPPASLFLWIFLGFMARTTTFDPSTYQMENLSANHPRGR